MVLASVNARTTVKAVDALRDVALRDVRRVDPAEDFEEGALRRWQAVA